MSLSYLFYDIETTGRNPCFDQIIQFAAIRTDLELRELQRYEILIRLNVDVVPSPQAMLIHQIDLQRLNQGQTEIAAITEIYNLVNQPGTISVGYNNLAFDDEFLRFSFYRNLLPAYTHQFKNGCSRLDMYMITLWHFLYKKDSLQWPCVDGKESFKLENLNKANHLAVGAAHDAMVDTEAVLALARIFIKDRTMWDYAVSLFDKETTRKRIEDIEKLDLDLWQAGRFSGVSLAIDKSFGLTYGYEAPVLYLGQHHCYQNQFYWLRLDKAELATMSVDAVASTLPFIHKGKLNEGLLFSPLSKSKSLSEERKQIMTANIQWLREHRDVLAAIADYHLHFEYEKIENVDVSAALYVQGFPSDQQQRLFENFHKAELDMKMRIAHDFSTFYQVLALRIMGRHHPEYLTEAQQEDFSAYLQQALHGAAAPVVDYRGKFKLTIQTALDELVAIEQERQQKMSITIREQNLLHDLKNYLMQCLNSSPSTLF